MFPNVKVLLHSLRKQNNANNKLSAIDNYSHLCTVVFMLTASQYKPIPKQVKTGEQIHQAWEGFCRVHWVGVIDGQTIYKLPLLMRARLGININNKFK